MTAKQRWFYLGALVLAMAVVGAVRWRSGAAETAMARSSPETQALQAALDKARQDAQGLQAALDKANQDLQAVQQERDDLKQQVARLQAGLKPEGAAPASLLAAGDLRDLQAAGLNQPAQELVQSLASRSDLIPYPGVLGGTMAFRPSARWVVAPHWVLADFDDGHILGWGIFRYTVHDGKITWTVVDSALN